MSIHDHSRPDPERLLRHLEAEKERQGRGRLKVFLGYARGVGKSYKMLDEARRRKSRGEDVVVAAVQGHIPDEVQSILDRLESVPQREIAGVASLDVEQVLRRRPQVCVVDPLARSNPPGSRHATRWQDVDELLANGISVLTSVNLVHIEELQERVSGLTGKETSETVPKHFLERADEIVIVDAPLDLFDKRGGSYPQEPAMDADQRRHLSELREMALLLAAEVVDRQLEAYAAEHGIELLWGSQERILVCITPRSNASAMIASGLRNKKRFQGELHIIHVRQPNLSATDQAQFDRYLADAHEAGAEVHILEGSDPVAAILDYARSRRITQIYVGHTSDTTWVSSLRGDTTTRLIRLAEGFDVCVFPH